MKWLFAVLAAISAVAAGVFLWRNKKESVNSLLGRAQHSTSSLGKTAAGVAGEATDKATDLADKTASATSDLADQAKGAVAH